jgi:DNA polymerase alpha subunit A
MMSVYGKRCLRNGCRGLMQYEYTDKAVYNQLLYAHSIFDCDKAKMRASKGPSEQVESINALAEQHRDTFGKLCNIVELYLSRCGRRYVDMGGIFTLT